MLFLLLLLLLLFLLLQQLLLFLFLTVAVFAVVLAVVVDFAAVYAAPYVLVVAVLDADAIPFHALFQVDPDKKQQCALSSNRARLQHQQQCQ